MGAVSHTSIKTAYNSIDEAFPPVDCGIDPYGIFVVVQIRSAKNKTKGGIILAEASKETEKWNTQTAKVIAIGPVAFRDRETLEPWPEGKFPSVGDYVRVPKYGGDKWEVAVPGSDEPALFVIFKDREIMGKVTTDPLSFTAFV